MKLHNPFLLKTTTSLDISILFFVVVLAAIVLSLLLKYPLVILPVLFIMSVVRILYATLKGR